MSRDVSSYGFVSKNANENDFETSSTSAHFPPPRTPLNSIPDPSQCQKDEHDVVDSKDKSEFNKALHKTTRLSNRHGRQHSESNSAQSTPSRTAPRFSLGGGVLGPCVTSRLTQVIGGKCGLSSTSSSRVPRGISVTDDSNFLVEAPHFELVEDPSFWRDRNVQVLIRIRPPSTMERVSQGYGRCLKQESAQTLLWLGHAETRFTFDHVACETISQEKLFRVVGQPMVENCLSGYNSCMFAYGQTGSGKTYTMMGEINEVEGQPNEDRGLTPRIFEYLFSRIRMEEESRKDEKLRFSCKCSFLEIYNEQITDLLDPSSTNLQLREDLKKGVYVENLMEYNVRNVDDVLKLLLQGASNRRMAATNMNSESSRSHSVFTCIIESQWEKDSMTHFRFARLNLVDLAGSERQKSSGAEGDRLKEAANINKSLSTLGLVIMSLVDMAHGKHRHVPYRDSRLTFLLQDSLGGNSKTTIIANVSPSICAANETLSTLKFAQRAKLIQNNAKVNEDASGDVNALQRQVEQLKGQLSSLLKHHKFSNSPSSCVPSCDELKMGVYSTKTEYTGEMDADSRIQNFNNNKMRRMEATLAGSLRREKMAETANQKLEAEIEQMNRLVCQKEEDVQRTKMMLRFREEKIKNLELLGSGLVSTEEYLIEENQALKAEIQLLRTKIDRNPELTRFALENIRLIEQLQIFQNFYEQGERETLLGEITELRNQLQEVLEEKNRFSSSYEDQDGNTVKELEDCRNMNSKLMREVEELQMELSKYLNCSHAAFDSVAVADSPSKDHGECRQTDKYSLVETISARSDSGDQIASSSQENHVALGNQNEQNTSVDSVMQHSATQKKLKDASLLIKEMEAQQVYLFKELHHLQEENKRYMEIISNENKLESESVHKVIHHLERDDLASRKEGPMESEFIEPKDLHDKLDRLTKDLEKARLLNCQYQQVQASQLSWQHEADLVREQVEMETARTILHLQEEVSELQSEFSEKLASITQENMRLRETIAAKEEEMKSFCVDWERATLELTSFLLDGSKSLKDASRTIENIACSFPQINSWVGENVERAARVCIEKEERILLLQTSLEDAQRAIVEMEMKLSSLKGATIAFNEFQESGVDVGMDEVASLSFLFNYETDLQKVLANELKLKEGQFLHQIKGEITQANQSLKLIKGCIKTEASLHVHLPNDEDGTDKDSWSSNSSTSSSGYSTESIASGNNLIGSHCSSKTTEAVDDMKFEEVSPQSDSGFSETSGTFDLRNELLKELNVFHKLYVWLTTILNVSDTGERSHTEELPSFGLTMEIDEAVSQNTIEALSDATSPAKNFFKQFEEAHATMKEADYTLNALLKANENAQVLNSIWRQANEELIAEKSNLIDELEKLRYSVSSKERENELLQDQIGFFWVETADTISLLEGCFQQMQRQIEDKFKVLYSDVLSMSQEVISTIRSSRSSLEDICSEMIEKEFSLFVLYQCHFGVFIHRTLNLSSELSSHPLHRPELHSVINTLVESHSIGQGENLVYHRKSSVAEDKGKLLKHLKDGDQDISHELIDENFSLKKELKRKEVLLEGLLFDLHLLQESASNSQEIKGESEKLMLGLKQVCHELEMKTIQVDDLLVQHKELENHLCDAENALLISNSNLEQAKETIDSLFNENAEMRKLVKDLYHKKAEAEEGLEEQKEVVKGLEKEILHLNYSLEKDIRSSIEGIEEELRKVTGERDELHEEIFSLNDQLEMFRALADENEAIAVEARQESEASKLYAEQKEEEVQILEHSVEELESTINVLEKKLCELDEEVERHRYIRISLEHELQYLRDRLSKVDNFVDVVHSIKSDTAQTEDLSSRQMHNRLLQLHEAHDQIRILEREKEELRIEIKQCKEYISELVLHSEAQASQYQQKYKTLEAMICERKIDLPTSTSTVSMSDKNEKTSTRSRGSSSPFRCISSFVQQMNSEKDQELSDARLRIEELEALSAGRQKEIYMLNTRLAAAESMTHDVIRDLLGVKLDITNYANLIDQDQVQKLLKEANQQAEEFLAKEQEILNLRKQVNDLMEEKESCSYEINKKDADMLSAQLTLEQLQQRDQLLSAQNEMLKMDKTNLIKRVAEMDELIKRLEGKKRINQTLQIKENGSSSLGGVDLGTRLANSERHVSRVNNELAQFRKNNGRLQPHDRTYGQGFEAKHR